MGSLIHNKFQLMPTDDDIWPLGLHFYLHMLYIYDFKLTNINLIVFFVLNPSKKSRGKVLLETQIV